MSELSGRHIYINLKKALMSAFVLLVLFRIPRSYLGVPYLYSMSYIARTLGSERVTFGITLFEVIAIIIGVVLYTQKPYQKTRYWPIFVYVIFANLFRYLFGYSNPITLNSYEIILSYIVALSCATIAQHYYCTNEDIESLFDIIIALFFVFQVYFILIGKAGRSGSYGTVGLSSGGLAECYVTYILLKLLINKTDKKSIILIIISGVGLVLTGSRTQLFLLLLFLVFYVTFMLSISSTRKWLLVGVGIAGFLIIVFGQNSIALLANNRKLQSLMNIFSTGIYSYVTGDASATERFKTWSVALNIIKQNPLGISCSVLDLQTRMFEGGSPTFPHSSILANYLLLGLPALVIYILFWKKLIDSKKYNTGLTLLLVYYVLVLTFYGGVGTHYLSNFWLVMMYEYFKKKISICKNQQREQSLSDD